MKSSFNSSAELSPKKLLVLGADSDAVLELRSGLLAHDVQMLEADAGALPAFNLAATPGLTILLLGLSAPAATPLRAADQALREVLHQSGQTFQVLYGDTGTQLRLALDVTGRPVPPPASGGWHVMCGACGDPDCERKLFHAMSGKS